MRPLVPLSKDVLHEDQCRRASARQGLHFHIDQWGFLIEYGGYKSESREATEPEVALWSLMVGPIDGVLRADPREFESCLVGPGPYYLSASDFTVMRRTPTFKAELMRERLLLGWFGTYGDAPIYVSRLIPEGYYLAAGRRVPELNWTPKSLTREIAPKLDEYLRVGLEQDLRPLLA